MNIHKLYEIKENILKHKIIVIFGNTGSGKTSTGFRVLSWFQKVKKCYIFKHPKPDVVQPLGFDVLHSLEELEYMEDVCVYIDEPQLHLPNYDRRSNEKFIKLASLCRQKDITLILSTSDTRYINKGAESYVDGWLIKNIYFNNIKNGSTVKNIIKRNVLIDPSGFMMPKQVVLYSNMDDLRLEGKYEILEASFYNEQLSKAYSNRVRNSENSENSEQIKKPKKVPTKKTTLDKFKVLANQYITNQVNAGNLKLEKCGLCGNTTSLNAHHKQYTYPFTLEDIQVLCSGCHIKTHNKLKKISE